MKTVIQRVSRAEVAVKNKVISKINLGLLVLLGITHADTQQEIDFLVEKITNLRIFAANNGKMNLSLRDIDGEILIVSQVTLYGACQKGNRPDFFAAAKAELALKLYNQCIAKCQKTGLKTQAGQFGTNMQVRLVNDGPVTIVIEK